MRLLIIICMAFAVLSASIAFASTEKSKPVQTQIKCEQSIDILTDLVSQDQKDNQQPHCSAEDSLDGEKLAGRGCCSWHGGVCGCASGRALCCDGQLSPSCGC